MPKIRITQERSQIRCIEKHKRTIEALGLRRINHFVIHEDTPQIRGMVAKVAYLVRVESATDEGAQSGARTKGPKATTKKAAGAKKAAASRAKRAAS